MNPCPSGHTSRSAVHSRGPAHLLGEAGPSGLLAVRERGPLKDGHGQLENLPQELVKLGARQHPRRVGYLRKDVLTPPRHREHTLRLIRLIVSCPDSRLIAALHKAIIPLFAVKTHQSKVCDSNQLPPYTASKSVPPSFLFFTSRCACLNTFCRLM